MAREEKKYNYIYRITCLKNERYYIGMHSTNNLEDGYLGGGKRIRNSVKKHGKENHRKEIIEFFKNRGELRSREIQIINEDLLNDPLCMNINLGGDGGWLKEWQSKGATNANNKNWKDPDYAEKMKLVSFKVMNDLWKDPEFCKKVTDAASKSFKGKTHTEDTRRKIGEKSSIAQKAESNSQFGTCWIHNLEEEINKRIKKEEMEKYLQEGWESGMKMRFFQKIKKEDNPPT